MNLISSSFYIDKYSHLSAQQQPEIRTMNSSSVGNSSSMGNRSLPPASQKVSNPPLTQAQALEQWEGYKTSIDRRKLYQDWPALRQSYQDAINFLKSSRNQGLFSEEKIDKRLRHYLTALSQFEREQGEIASAERLAQETDWLEPSFNTNNSKKRDLERGSSSEFRNPKGGAPNFLDRPQVAAVNTEIDALINGVTHINLKQHSRLFLQSSSQLHQFSWPTSPNEIAQTDQLVNCLREGNKRNMDSAQLRPYQALAEKILECFGEKAYPSLSTIQEVVILVKATQNLTHYRRLIDQLQTTPQQILNMAALQGLVALMQHRSKHSTLLDMYFFDDCTKLLDYIHQLLIRTRRKDNAVQLGALLQTSSSLLDSLFDAGYIVDEAEFKGSLEESLAALTDVQDTKSHMDESLAFQAKYALQALKRLRQPKEWRSRVWNILRDFAGAAAYGTGAIASKDPDKFWEAIDRANTGFSKLKDELQSYYKQREWYLALYRIDKGIEVGHFNGLELFVQGWSRPKKRYLLQGLCFRLERIALSQMEDETKAWSLNLLKSLMAGDSVWGREKDLVGVKSCANATLQRIVHFWNLPTTEMMERVDYAPPAWHPFWMNQPQSTLLARVRQKVKQEEAIHAKLAGLDQAVSAGFAQTALQIEAGQSNMQMQAMFQSMMQHVLALQASQQQALHPKPEPLSILGDDIATFKAEYRGMLQNTGEMDVLSMYVPLRGFEKSQKSGPTIDLESELAEFFNSPARVCLLLGSAGTGKSTFNRYLALKMLEEYQGLSTTDQCQPLVFFVELRSIPDPNEKVIEQFFDRHRFTQDQIDLLRTHPHQHCIFIFDGYDEIKERNRDFYGSNGLWKWKHAKFVITSRPEYLDPNYALYFRPSNQPSGLYEYSIAPFSVDQCAHYIQKYVHKACPKWTVDDYKQAFSQLSTLESELARPIVLRLLLQTLPELNLADPSCLTLGKVY